MELEKIGRRSGDGQRKKKTEISQQQYGNQKGIEQRRYHGRNKEKKSTCNKLRYTTNDQKMRTRANTLYFYYETKHQTTYI